MFTFNVPIFYNFYTLYMSQKLLCNSQLTPNSVQIKVVCTIMESLKTRNYVNSIQPSIPSRANKWNPVYVHFNYFIIQDKVSQLV